MPIDPSIPGLALRGIGAQTLNIGSILDSLRDSDLREQLLQSQIADRELARRVNEQTLADKQRTAQEAQETATREREVARVTNLIRSGTPAQVEALIAEMPDPRAQSTVSAWYDTYQKGQREIEDKENLQRRDMARALLALPAEQRVPLAEVGFRLDRHPDAQRIWDAIKDSPEQVNNYLSAWANFGEKPAAGQFVDTTSATDPTAAVKKFLVPTPGQEVPAAPKPPASDQDRYLALVRQGLGRDLTPEESLKAIQDYTLASTRAPREPAGPKPKSVPAATATKIGDINSAIDQAKTLRSELLPVRAGADAGGVKAPTYPSGAAAWAQSFIPEQVTDLTGWGAGAHAKEALVALVKQVIGKGLEGGVLRKEDESKYAKILPGIQDSEATVRAKLDGLDQALASKRQQELDALADAGYDVEAFQQRTPRAADTPTPDAAPAKKRRRVFNMQTGQFTEVP